jgi:hypothetical protein
MATLQQLLSCDLQLIELAKGIESAAEGLNALAWKDNSDGARTKVDSPLADLETAMKNRMQLLLLK